MQQRPERDRQQKISRCLTYRVLLTMECAPPVSLCVPSPPLSSLHTPKPWLRYTCHDRARRRSVGDVVCQPATHWHLLLTRISVMCGGRQELQRASSDPGKRKKKKKNGGGKKKICRKTKNCRKTKTCRKTNQRALGKKKGTISAEQRKAGRGTAFLPSFSANRRRQILERKVMRKNLLVVSCQSSPVQPNPTQPFAMMGWVCDVLQQQNQPTTRPTARANERQQPPNRMGQLIRESGNLAPHA